MLQAFTATNPTLSLAQVAARAGLDSGTAFHLVRRWLCSAMSSALLAASIGSRLSRSNLGSMLSRGIRSRFPFVPDRQRLEEQNGCSDSELRRITIRFPNIATTRSETMPESPRPACADWR